MLPTDWELWACADHVLRQHGASAQTHVAERISVLPLAGDAGGVAAWRVIANRIDRLSEKPAFNRQMH